MSEVITKKNNIKTICRHQQNRKQDGTPPASPPPTAAAIATTPGKRTGIIDDDVHPLASSLPARDQRLRQPFRVVCQKVLGTGPEHLREYVTAAGRVPSILGTSSVRTWGRFWECLLSSSHPSAFMGAASKFPNRQSVSSSSSKQAFAGTASNKSQLEETARLKTRK